MRRLSAIPIAAIAFLAVAAGQRAPRVLSLAGDVEGVHDPVIAREDGHYYVFSTGRAGYLLPIRRSDDLIRWTLAGSVFSELPEWARTGIPGVRTLWAPDISRFRGEWHLYYSVSTFGSNESAIGLATNRTLNPQSPEYRWVDRGLVVRSHKTDGWNAIDPNVFIEDEDHAWLVWGSFWGGIQMRRIDPATGKPPAEAQQSALARRSRTPPVNGSIEAPFLVRREGWYYLFASFDFCCRGAKSTYRVVVGRSREVTGPYVDRSGTPMLEGGGTPVIEATTANWRGPGHEAVYRDGTTDYLVFHAYHGETGRPYLHISTMVWEDGWPRVGALP